eukprot:SAG31_NODE_5648_length_2404_cov_2.372234_2_plen_100_part_00
MLVWQRGVRDVRHKVIAIERAAFVGTDDDWLMCLSASLQAVAAAGRGKRGSNRQHQRPSRAHASLSRDADIISTRAAAYVPAACRRPRRHHRAIQGMPP